MAGKIRKAPGWLGLSQDRSEFLYLEERAKVVQRIFQLSISGMGGFTIARLLNEENVPAFGSSGKWDQSTIHNMLSSRATIGEYQKKEIIDGKEVPAGKPVPSYYPAVIDLKTFEAAQLARRQNLLKRRGRKGSRITNLFADIPICAYCGSGVKLHNAPVKSLVCKTVWGKNGCVAYKWTYVDFEKTFLGFLIGTKPDLQLRVLVDEANEASIQNQPAELNRKRLALIQLIRSTIVELRIAFGGKNPDPTRGFISRDHPDRFFEVTFADGSSHTCYSSPPEKLPKAVRLDPQHLSAKLGLSERQGLITALLAEGETLSFIAKEHGITLSTARWHLREIFKRTKCHSQAELQDLVGKTFRSDSTSGLA